MTRFVDRRTGELVTESVFGGDTLDLLYGRLRPLTDRLLTGPAFNHFYGWLQRRPASRGKISAFVKDLGIDPEEAELPIDQYRSLDDFFTRRLKPSARPIDRNPDHLPSPVDARAVAFKELHQELRVKSSSVTLEELTGSPALAAKYEGGPGYVFRLAPADYHRFHFPESGTITAPRRIEGRLHSVHPVALAAGAPSFRNLRDVSELATKRFGDLLLIEVGALCVGTITQTHRAGPVTRGEEKGYFRFGGSTVVLIAQSGKLQPDEDLLRATNAGHETQVRLGSRVGRTPV